MEKFAIIKGVAASLNIDNVDTDMLIPKNFLKTVKRSGLGVHLFQEIRYDTAAAEIPDFVLNREPYRQAKLLVSGKNFGCGSSREHAPWALADFGIRVILAESFADIFSNNASKNGILTLPLPAEQLEELRSFAEQGLEFTVDLEEQQITVGTSSYQFAVEDLKRRCLLEGLDDIDLILESEAAINRHEKSIAQLRPWLA